MGQVVVGLVGIISGVGASAATASTIGGIASAAINAGIAIGVNSYQKKKAKQRAARAQASAKRAQAAALRRLKKQQERVKAAAFEVPFVTNDVTIMVRNPIAGRRIPYGRSRLGGIWFFYEKTGTSGEYRHLMLDLGEGPIEEVETIYFDDQAVTLDADGEATGTYAGHARVKIHLGDETEIAPTFTTAFGTDANALNATAHGFSNGDRVQLTSTGTLPAGLATATDYWVINKTAGAIELSATRTGSTPVTLTSDGTGTHTATRMIADYDAVSECANWTDTHKAVGVAYLYIRLKNNIDLFPNVLPQISAVVKGRNDIEDIRTGATGYSTNAALCQAHYLRQPIYASGVDADAINPDELANAATICDQRQARAVSASVTTDYGTDDELFTSAGHGRADGDVLFLETTDTLPAPMLEETPYYVRDSTTNTFKLSATSGGAAVELTSNGTGTHSWRLTEARYQADGVIDLANDVDDNRSALASAMAGQTVFSSGYWNLFAGAYIPPTFEITEDMIVGEMELSRELPRRERVNLVKGVFVSEENSWQLTGFPSVTNPQYKADDAGREIMRDIQLPFTKSAYAAQRIAKRALEENRLGTSLNLKCNLRAFPAQAGRTVLVTISRYGFDRKPFEVGSSSLSLDDGRNSIELTLRETDASVDSWSHTEEQAIRVPASLVKPGTKVAAITSTPAGGSGHSFPLGVTLATVTSGAAIRYSKTAIPSTVASGAEYTGSVSMSDGETLYAKAFLDGYQDSDDFSATFTT